MHLQVCQEFLLNDAAKNVRFMRNHIISSTLSDVHVHSPESVTNNALTPTPACGWMRRCLQAKSIRKRLIKTRNRRVGPLVKSGKHGGIINGGLSVLPETLYPFPIGMNILLLITHTFCSQFVWIRNAHRPRYRPQTIRNRTCHQIELDVGRHAPQTCVEYSNLKSSKNAKPLQRSFE